jgi:hypothetical protein
MSATVVSEGAVGASSWLTFDEVVERLRFPSRRALFAHLRRHPAPVYQRVGSRRYFFRSEDVDRMMAPIDLRIPRNAVGAGDENRDAATYVQVDPAAPTNGVRRRGRPRKHPKP